jgi:L-alanine-DL-glutamate epimerase-like enolase superfamily enzyme
VRAAIAALGSLSADRGELSRRLAAGAARNAVDCALWDWDAKRSGTAAAALAGLPAPLRPVTTAYTLSLGSPDAMAARAASVPALPLLKLKLGGEGDAERLRAVRSARPDARLIADANEAWTPALLPGLMAVAAETGIEVLEQPLPAGADAALAAIERRVPVCADEGLHTRADLTGFAGRYDAVNVKLDKAGGLTEALALAAAARAAGLRIMVGCMVATSLAMAPALLLAQDADWVDLDGPLLLARDREPGLVYEGALVHPPPPKLWG